MPLAHLIAARCGAEAHTVTVGGEGHEVAAGLVLAGDPTGALLDRLTDGERTLCAAPGTGMAGSDGD